MKRFVSFVLFSCILLAAAPLAAQDARPQFNTIVVKHFTNAGKVRPPQDFIDRFSAGLIGELQWLKIANQVVAEGAPVAAGDSSGSITIEGKFAQYDKGGEYAPGQLDVVIDIYRIGDGALIKTISNSIPFRPLKPSSRNKDRNPGEYTGGQTALFLQQTLRKIALPAPVTPAANLPAPSGAPPAATPGVAAAPAVPAPPAPSAAPAAAVPSATAPPSTAQPCSAVLANTQISSDPTGAEIVIDGKYQGNTPSVINLKPGVHSIKLSRRGYQPWVRSIETAAGESRTIAADLEPAK